jgi:hypothetical protein
MKRQRDNEPALMVEAPVAAVPPPIPAPYLQASPGIPAAPQLESHLSYGSQLSVPDEQLDRNPRLRLELQKQVRDAARAIRRRRKDWQDEQGVVIDVDRFEKPLAD